MSPVRNRNIILVVILVLVPCCLFVLLSVPDIGSEKLLVQRLADLQIKLQYLDMAYRARQEDLQQLSQHLDQLAIPALLSPNYPINAMLSMDNKEKRATIGRLMPNSSDSLSLPATESSIAGDAASAILAVIWAHGGIVSRKQNTLPLAVRQIIRNMSGMYALQGLNSNTMLRLPSTYHFMPHLLDDTNSLRVAYRLSKGRTGVSTVLGIPTVRRDRHSYLMETLQSLIDGMSSDEKEDTLVVVFVAEVDLMYVLQIAKEIELRFANYVESGLIEVLSPSASYYPDMDNLRKTLGDSPERVKWRSKQNLDFAYLMSYCQPKGTFYVQLEDDILAKPYYITEMKRFALEKTANKEPWFVLDFCQLGFIGKMFKTAELPWLIHFFQMFYNDKPVDWLLDDLIYTKICNTEKNKEFYKHDKAKMWIHYKPSLFQHIGTHSSLKGKVQKLKDKQFGKVALFLPHVNPEAEIFSDIKCYKQFTLNRAYLGETFFWGLLPQPGDRLLFKFRVPVLLKRFFFRSGNAEHPSDKLYNTTVEMMPMEDSAYHQHLNTTSDGYIVVAEFDNVGIAKGDIDERFGKILAVRLYVHSESENWAILSEIHLQDGSATT